MKQASAKSDKAPPDPEAAQKIKEEFEAKIRAFDTAQSSQSSQSAAVIVLGPAAGVALAQLLLATVSLMLMMQIITQVDADKLTTLLNTAIEEMNKAMNAGVDDVYELVADLFYVVAYYLQTAFDAATSSWDSAWSWGKDLVRSGLKKIWDFFAKVRNANPSIDVPAPPTTWTPQKSCQPPSACCPDFWNQLASGAQVGEAKKHTFSSGGSQKSVFLRLTNKAIEVFEKTGLQNLLCCLEWDYLHGNHFEVFSPTGGEFKGEFFCSGENAKESWEDLIESIVNFCKKPGAKVTGKSPSASQCGKQK